MEEKRQETIKFKGKYTSTVGRRKNAVARVRIYSKGSGAIAVNDMKIDKYFDADGALIAKQPLKLTGYLKNVDISIMVKGSGKKSQAEAVRHGISRGLIAMDEKLKITLKAKGWLTRDARKKERKKPGLKKARRAPQWSKR